MVANKYGWFHVTRECTGKNGENSGNHGYRYHCGLAELLHTGFLSLDFSVVRISAFFDFQRMAVVGRFANLVGLESKGLLGRGAWGHSRRNF